MTRIFLAAALFVAMFAVTLGVVAETAQTPSITVYKNAD